MPPAGRAKEAAVRGPGLRVGVWAEDVLGTSLQVLHLQEELNARLLGKLCWEDTPLQAVVAGLS